VALALIAGLVACDRAMAQSPYIPPDIFGDAHQGTCMIRKNNGQVLDSDLQQRPEIKGYFEGSPIGIYLSDKSKVSFTLGAMHHDSVTADTLYRLDMVLSKTKERTPNFHYPAAGIANYYRGSIAAEGVVANYRAVYTSIEDSIDCHFYGSKGGPRIAFVIHPGGNPADIKLSFLGQDSLGVDWQGALKVYLEDKWVKLEQAVAYQVSGTTLIPVPWTGGYTHEEGTAYAGFTFGDYNPELPLILQIGYPSMMGGGDENRDLGWCTFVGGSGGDELTSVEVDEVGDPYTCGYTSSYDFPVSPGTEVYPPFIPDAAGWTSAVVMKYLAFNKQLAWATYYGGDYGTILAPRTDAQKLAVYKGTSEEHQYVFVVGGTTATDLPIWAEPGTPFTTPTSFTGGITRSWIGAFKKANGVRDWCTTHGEVNGATWCEHALAVDVDDDGRVAMAGIVYPWSTTTEPSYPVFVQAQSNFSRSIGDGFFVVFDENYELDWASAFCEFSWSGLAYGRLTDIEFTRNHQGHKSLWLVGSSVSGSDEPLEVVPPPTTPGYFQGNGGFRSAVIAMIDIEERDLDYCTRWGSPGENYSTTGAFGVHQTQTGTWIVGFTDAQDLSSTELPAPPQGQGGAIYTTTHQGSTVSQWSDGFVLRFKPGAFELSYGTLIGGVRDDIVLDVNSDRNGRVFFTGETRSASGIAMDIDPSHYYQPHYNFVNRRDALILCMADEAHPTALWRTVFGGRQSDRGWGIAASATEVFLVGATASQQDEDDFPLWEFDTDPFTLDFFQDYNLLGNANGMVPWNEFFLAMDYENNGFGENQLESIYLGHDAFIASFGSTSPVGLPVVANSDHASILVWSPNNGSSWLAQLPSSGLWTLRVYDSSGRLTQTAFTNGTLAHFELHNSTPGIYLVIASNDIGEMFSTKLLKP
jgi:hypothetical protein